MATKVALASSSWVIRERQNIANTLSEEKQDMQLAGVREAEWINEHLQEILAKTKFTDLAIFKTPGRLRGGKTPKTIVKSIYKSAFKGFTNAVGITEPNPGRWIAPIETAVEEIPVIPETVEPEEPQIVPETQHQHGEAPEEPAVEQEELPEPIPERSPVRLYTDSDIGSPSIADTPEQPVRKGSFSFASLPPREPLKQSLGAPISAIKPSATRQQSLGLDSDDSDDESVDLRAPELIAHEQRMRAYELSPSPPSVASFEPDLPAEVVSDMPGMYPTIEPLEDEPVQPAEPTPARRRTRSSGKGKRKADELDEESTPDQMLDANSIDVNDFAATEALDETKSLQQKPAPPVRQSTTAPASTRADRSRLRAPKPLGRPVRPTTAARSKQQPQPVAIKIKPLAHPKPMNTAPVAAHNQDAVRADSTQPELKSKASVQSIASGNSSFNKSTNKAPSVPSKVFSLAQKKKEADEKAAARDAAVKQQQKERRDNKIEEIRRKKREEEAELERKARENSAERRRKHLVDLDDREVKRQKSEERQEREQAAADAQKAAFKEMQEKRQIRPAVKSAVTRPQNPPARPPARMDLHEDMRAEEDTPPRLAAPLRQPSLQRPQPPPQADPDLPPYPSNLSKPPVRVSHLGKKTSIFTTTHAGPSTYTTAQAGPSALQSFPQPPRTTTQQAPQMQHFATQRIPFAQTPMHAQQYNQPGRAPGLQVPGNNATFAPLSNGPRSTGPLSNLATVSETSPMSLPEIHTDSSDDSDRNVSLPSWATPNHVFNTLSQQETINPDHIFPTIPTISMDDVFAENPDRLRRLRMRTSSANWVRTGDALTQVEVIEDRIGRQAIRNAGGWIYGLSNGNNNGN